MNPQIEELRRLKEEAEKKMEQYTHQAKRIENRMQYYREKERRERNHRLIVRGATVESIWPEVKSMSQEDYDRLMRKVLTLPDAQEALNEITGGSGEWRSTISTLI